MRHVVAVLAVIAASAPGRAQDRVKYWPDLEVGLPVPAAALELRPKPTKLRLYARPAGGGRFEQVNERDADKLQDIPRKRPGFVYTAKADGEEEFAVQLVYADGTVSPQTDRLRVEARVVFDTRIPAVALDATGTRVSWTISDPNLDPAETKLECKWADRNDKWYEVKPDRGGNWPDRGDYSWAAGSLRDRTLEVRVYAKDRAGNDAFSRIVKLPRNGVGTDDGGGGSFKPDPRVREPRAEFDTPGQPQITYTNDPNLSLKYKLTTVTRSGVAAAHLFQKTLTDAADGPYKPVQRDTTDITPDTANPQIEMKYKLPDAAGERKADGRYGFVIIPENGAGQRNPDPRPTTPPQFLVEYDTTVPVVKVKGVTVSPGGAAGPRVDIEWDVVEKNLLPDPIDLEYADWKSPDNWQPITEKLPNSRRYTWEVTDKKLFKFFIRVRATDKASNQGVGKYEQVVNIDLEKPDGVPDGIKAGGAGGGSTSERRANPAAGGPVVPSKDLGPTPPALMPTDRK